MALYAMSDTHLSFSSGKPMDIFGSRWKAHDEKIDEMWRSYVTDADTVVIGGDVSWALTLDEATEDLLFLDRLPGRKLLLRGNHDYWWSTLKKIGEMFDRNGITTVGMIQNNCVEADGFAICGTRGWYVDASNSPRECDFNKIRAREVQRLRISLESASESSLEKIVFLHFPPYFENYIFNELIDLLLEFGVKRCFYGHIHGKYDIPRTTSYKGIEFTITSADYLNFAPLEIAHSQK